MLSLALFSAMPLGMIQVSPCDSLHCFSLLPFTDHASGHTSLYVAFADKTLQPRPPPSLQNNSQRMCMLLRKRRAKMCSLLRVLQQWRASAQCIHRDMVCKRCSPHSLLQWLEAFAVNQATAIFFPLPSCVTSRLPRQLQPSPLKESSCNNFRAICTPPAPGASKRPTMTPTFFVINRAMLKRAHCQSGREKTPDSFHLDSQRPFTFAFAAKNAVVWGCLRDKQRERDREREREREVRCLRVGHRHVLTREFPGLCDLS